MVAKLIAGMFVFAIGLAILVSGVGWLFNGPPDFFALINPNQPLNMSPYDSRCDDIGFAETELNDKVTFTSDASGRVIVSEKGKIKIMFSNEVLREYKVLQDGEAFFMHKDQDEYDSTLNVYSSLVRKECLGVGISSLKYIAANKKDARDNLTKKANSEIHLANNETATGNYEILDIEYFVKNNIHFLVTYVSFEVEGKDFPFYTVSTLILRENGYFNRVVVSSVTMETLKTLSDSILSSIVFEN